jgi:hypothetical protein
MVWGLLVLLSSNAQAVEPETFAGFLASLELHAAAVDELHKQATAGEPHWQAAGFGAPYVVRLLATQQPKLALEVAEESLEEAGDASEETALYALALEANGQHLAASQRLSTVEAFATDPQTRTYAGKLRCALHLRAEEYAAARDCLPLWLPGIQKSRRLATLARSPNKSWWLGGALSAVVPGLGQAVAGDAGDAVAALAVNGALWTATVDLYVDGFAVDGTLLLVGMTSRYYLGNIQHGARSMERATVADQKAAAQSLLQQLVALPEAGSATSR